MMGRQTGDQSQLFYLFKLEGRSVKPSSAPDQSDRDARVPADLVWAIISK
jgi:hypothetical protein